MSGFDLSIPESLRGVVQQALASVAVDDIDPAIREQLPRVLGGSEFVANALARNSGLLAELAGGKALQSAAAPGSIAAEMRRLLDSCADESAFMAALRRIRSRELVRIAWRDLTGQAALEETLRDLTALADAAIAEAATFATRGLIARYGTPRSPEGEAQELVVLGMGKLGGGELNFSSDVDLVFLFPQAGETDGARSVSNEEFFTRAGRALIRILDAVTSDGFVYRVDMRLRPFGDSGPLVASFPSFENYLQQHGRDWERYAYVKARAITGSAQFASLFDEAVRPFVYRRYLDFGVFESLRGMKELIAREVARRELRDNIKLGPGGIREIEFIVQAFQLLRGGGDRRLQSPSLLAVLPRLAGQKLLPAQAVNELAAAYAFLRQFENRLQMIQDEQTHTLPTDPLSQARLMFSMGAPDFESLRARLETHRAAVTAQFQAILFAPAGSSAATAAAFDLEALWDTSSRLPVLREAVAGFGLGDDGGLASIIAAWFEESSVQRLDEAGRRRLQVLVPRILQGLSGVADRNVVLQRVLGILDAVGGRSVYFALLNENSAALGRLLDICQRSDFLTRQIASFPLLLDELIDGRVLEELPTREHFIEQLASRREHAPDADPERQVERLRQFQRAATFRVALADLTARLPLMQVSDRLTDIAELILEEAMSMAWQQLAQMHGAPMCGDGRQQRPALVAAIAYGKLGGIELGYGSDLDLVFLHDSAGEVQRTAGPKPIDNGVFFLRLGQRILHLLTLHSAAGRLYEVDMRLRPSGKGGLMVTQLAAFENYQKQEAWTWEHQALLRARAVAGALRLREAFERVRLDVLSHHVRRDTLQEEVRRMRERMRAELSRSKAGEFDVKQDAGGLADIEFLAQYWALAWADRYPPLVMFSDTIRQLESVASADLVPQATVDVLTAAYREYRSELHHRSLENAPAIVADSHFAATRGRVLALWNAAMPKEPGG